ncbi:MAG: NAD-glutamate dehydrogenase [Pseudomonadota bacterium]
MSKSKSQDRHSIIKQIVDETTRHSESKLDDSLRVFLTDYYAKVPIEDLRALDTLDLRGAALSHWRLAKQRKVNQSHVHVYNPHFEKNGWQSTHTIVEIATDDRPFLVDSVSVALNRAGFTTHLTIHPVFEISRAGNGTIKSIGDSRKDSTAESFMHFQIDKLTDKKRLADLKASIESVVDDVQRVTDDWRDMRAKALDIAASLTSTSKKKKAAEISELDTFLNWLAEDNFTFLGHCEFSKIETSKGAHTLKPKTNSSLGLMRGCSAERLRQIVPYQNQAYVDADWLVDVNKTDAPSTVHRPSRMELITVQHFDDKGKPSGRSCFVGLFTSSAYNLSVSDVPQLRKKVAWVVDQAGLDPQSHNGKAMANILETYPRDALFQSNGEEVLEIATGILHLQERQRIRLFGRSDQYQRFQSCMVFVPRERYSRELRLKIQEILTEAMDGLGVEFDTLFSSESILARLYYVIYTDPNKPTEFDLGEVEQRIIEAARTWQDNLGETLTEQFGEEQGNDFFSAYHDAFPSSYRDHFAPRTACFDIRHIENSRTNGTLEMNFYRPLTGDTASVNFKLFSLDGFIAPSDILPVFENMGLRVQGAHPYELQPRNTDPVWVHEYTLTHTLGDVIDPDAVGEIFQDAFARIWRGEVENDGFNRLVIGASLNWRDTVMLRAYCKYLLQIRVPFSQSYMIDTLAANTHITAKLVELFHGRFDPDNTLPKAKQEKIGKSIREMLDEVSNLDEDRILRGFLNLIESTLRTNFYQPDERGENKPYLSFKLDPANINKIPLPRPMFEIFVISPRTEGVHLRGGRVARGGLRWSDRREDFRTEVLGLMKAQMVKNSVIVPVGSKGGFVVKQPPVGGDRDAMMNEVVYCYKTFLRGLLDLTDNLVNNKIAAPPQVVRYDGDDPYLVVAADKGTATFSDIANSVSDEYNFWLGDAFASGGSIGYDHKKMGITARGAWESVKRHFRERGIDTQSQPISVVGIGDMGGDVFGNGMLLSKHLKLVGAFNHMHIFLDPDPDPAKSFVERDRMFKLPRSTWEDYDKKLISKGGGIFSRSAKSISLTPQVKKMLDIDSDSLPPNELINCMLKAPVDLLWNGGIGTYVKAKTESHADVRDRANDAVRVDGSQLRCKVVGEGGNLGLTQLGRIEYAQQGGILYTDAIDNSAGVDCSDHEVNIKILINAAVDKGDMTSKQRNKLLADMTDEVGDLVLKDNYDQTQAISIENARAKVLLEEHARFMQTLEAAGKLNPQIEFLPEAEEIAERMADKKGLVRPELAVVVSYSKMTMFDELVDSTLPEDDFLTARLIDYFPTPLRKKFAPLIVKHRLRREIIATVVTNELVNRVGPTFAHRMYDQIGAHSSDVCSAFVAGVEIFDMRELWHDIEALDNKVSATTQLELLALVAGLSERCIHWLVRNRRTHDGITAMIEYFKPGVEQLRECMPKPLAEINQKTLTSRTQYFVDAGVPKALANRVAMVVPYSSALDIVDIATQKKEKIEDVASVFFALGSVLELTWLRDQIASLEVSNHWHLLAKSGLRTDLHARQSSLTADVLSRAKRVKDAGKRVDSWQQTQHENIDKYSRLIGEMKASKSVDFAMLSLAVNEVLNLQQ